MREELSGEPPRASDSVATFRNVEDQADLPFAEFRGARLAPTYDDEPIAEVRNAVDPAYEIVAESRKWLPAMADTLWKLKQVNAIHELIGGDAVAKLRTIYCWCAGKNEPLAFVLIKLLRSPQGWRVFEYLMRGCQQPWWLQLKRQLRNGAKVDAARFE